MNAEHDGRRSCYTKKAYTDPRLAARVAARVERKRGVRLRVYGCTLCGQYHLTKQVERERE